MRQKRARRERGNVQFTDNSANCRVRKSQQLQPRNIALNLSAKAALYIYVYSDPEASSEKYFCRKRTRARVPGRRTTTTSVLYTYIYSDFPHLVPFSFSQVYIYTSLANTFTAYKTEFCNIYIYIQSCVKNRSFAPVWLIRRTSDKSRNVRPQV